MDDLLQSMDDMVGLGDTTVCKRPSCQLDIRDTEQRRRSRGQACQKRTCVEAETVTDQRKKYRTQRIFLNEIKTQIKQCVLGIFTPRIRIYCSHHVLARLPPRFSLAHFCYQPARYKTKKVIKRNPNYKSIRRSYKNRESIFLLS